MLWTIVAWASAEGLPFCSLLTEIAAMGRGIDCKNGNVGSMEAT
jgi:hypothetical protein